MIGQAQAVILADLDALFWLLLHKITTPDNTQSPLTLRRGRPNIYGK